MSIVAIVRLQRSAELVRTERNGVVRYYVKSNLNRRVKHYAASLGFDCSRLEKFTRISHENYEEIQQGWRALGLMTKRKNGVIRQFTTVSL